MFIPLFLFFVAITSSCGQVHNPCKDRIDYSSNDINASINLVDLFAPPSALELESVRKSWADFDASSTQLIIEQVVTLKERKIQIISHVAEDRKHYGAIVLPLNYDSTQVYPMMIWAEGLSQDNPLVDVSGYGLGFSRQLPNYFVLIPSFRGQSLKVNDNIYCSDGFFGDAYDGATDDVLRFMQVSFDLYDSSIDHERLAIYGGSRGGTVALLTGIRYPEIGKVVSQSGPVQFHNRQCYDIYGFQFRYQFLNQELSLDQIRQKLIKCSPIYFIDYYKNDLFILHGKHDPIVPIWNAESIIDIRGNGNKLQFLITEGGHSVSAAREVALWIKQK